MWRNQLLLTKSPKSAILALYVMNKIRYQRDGMGRMGFVMVLMFSFQKPNENCGQVGER